MEGVKKALLRGDKDGLVISLAEVIHNYPADVVQMILDLPYFDGDDEKTQAARKALTTGFHNCLTHESEDAQKSVLELILEVLSSIDIDFTPRIHQFSRFCGHWGNRGLRGLKGFFSRVAGVLDEEIDVTPAVESEAELAPAAREEVISSPVEIKPVPRAKAAVHVYAGPKPPTYQPASADQTMED